MSVTGNASKLSEKIECAVCGREGFFRIDDDGRRVLHPYSEPCAMPPRPPVVHVPTYRETLVHVRPRAA